MMEYMDKDEMLSLLEKKDKFIKNNTLMSDEQKQEIQDYVDRYANFEKTLGEVLGNNWNKLAGMSYDQIMGEPRIQDIVRAIQAKKLRAARKAEEKKAVAGLGLNVDYIPVFSGEYKGAECKIYTPLTWKGSHVLGSDNVPPKNAGRPDAFKGSDGRTDRIRVGWCISTGPDSTWKDYYWKMHINYGEGFLFIFGETIPTRKLAMCICKNPAGGVDANGIRFHYSLGQGYYYNIFVYDDGLMVPEDSTEVLPQYTYPYRSSFAEKDLFELISREKAIEMYEAFRTSLNKADETLSEDPETGIINIDDPSYNLKVENYVSNGRLTKKFGTVACDFRCVGVRLESLEGCPTEVGGDFVIKDAGLKSLKGGPKKVAGDYVVSYNPELTSLEGAPTEVLGNFVVNDNGLTSLEFSPEKVGKIYNCSNNNLTSLEGCTEQLTNFFCKNNPRLTSLVGGPKEVIKSYNCSLTGITSLEGAPEQVGGSFICSDCELTSLKGAPVGIQGSFDCSGNKHLGSLVDGPQVVGLDYYCTRCGLSSLVGSPEHVNGDFNCAYNNLTSLEGTLKSVGGVFTIRGNNINIPKKKMHIMIKASNIQA